MMEMHLAKVIPTPMSNRVKTSLHHQVDKMTNRRICNRCRKIKSKSKSKSKSKDKVLDKNKARNKAQIRSKIKVRVKDKNKAKIRNKVKNLKGMTILLSPYK